MEESKLHLSIEGDNFEEIYSKVQQIKKLINKINVELKKELEKSQIEMKENRIGDKG